MLRDTLPGADSSVSSWDGIHNVALKVDLAKVDTAGISAPEGEVCKLPLLMQTPRQRIVLIDGTDPCRLEASKVVI